MNQRSIGVAEQVAEFASKEEERFDGDPLEQSGLAIVAMLQEAAELSNDTCEHAEALADELSRDLRAAEDRINQLEAEIKHFHDRAARAESWLHLIRKELDEKLIAPMAATLPKSMI